MFENFGQFFLWLFLLGCLLPTLVVFVVGFIIYRVGRNWIDDFVTPDTEKIRTRLDNLREKHPDMPRDRLVRRIVNEHAFRCGVIGSVTGIGGLVTLPIALPIDILLTAQLQSTMVGFIAELYGYEDSTENKLATFAVLKATGELAVTSEKLLLKYAPRFAGKTLSKLIPFLGAGISFALNWVLAQATARLAIQWYESKSRGEILGTGDADVSDTPMIA